ncbi:MAG: hypothetical protein DRH50_06835 [Deltaproteobacteria bacterium]|nr:MAG: hypothetical protein DRH50_06835 [Deltaproteobacteria bacterium]
MTRINSNAAIKSWVFENSLPFGSVEFAGFRFQIKTAAPGAGIFKICLGYLSASRLARIYPLFTLRVMDFPSAPVCPGMAGSTPVSFIYPQISCIKSRENTQVLQNHARYGMNGVKKLTYPVQFFGPGMFNVTRHERHLFFVLFAHFLVAPFFDFVVISVWTANWPRTGKRRVGAKVGVFQRSRKPDRRG